MQFFLEILCVQGQWGGQQLFQEKQFQLKAKYLRCGPTVISFVLIFEEKKENIILQMICHLFDIFCKYVSIGSFSRGERSIETIALLVQSNG